jgi:hypothetical protein
MRLNHKKIVQDYNKLIAMYEVPEDLTGGMVIEEHLMEAVEKGTKTACARAVLSIIEYGFQHGDGVYRYQDRGSYSEVNADDCEYINYMYETYILQI